MSSSDVHILAWYVLVISIIHPTETDHFLAVVLGVFLVSSESQDADVQCFESDSSTALDDSASPCQSFLFYFIYIPWPRRLMASAVHTEQFQAMYRVLNAFSLINAILGMFALPSAVLPSHIIFRQLFLRFSPFSS